MSAAIPEIYLRPGDFHFGAAPLRLTTLLGSCISVTLWHPRRHIGGMCHIQLPTRSRQPADKIDGRYADDAFALFDQALARHGTSPGEYVVKLFGGGNMFAGTEAAAIDVGNRNVAATRKHLAARGMVPSFEHVGGAGHRKLIFDLTSGEVRLAFVHRMEEKETVCG